jgi:hypothetical protein
MRNAQPHYPHTEGWIDQSEEADRFIEYLAHNFTHPELPDGGTLTRSHQPVMPRRKSP